MKPFVENLFRNLWKTILTSSLCAVNMSIEHSFCKVVGREPGFGRESVSSEMMRELARGRGSKAVLLGLGLVLLIITFGIVCRSASAEHSPNPYPFGKSTYWAWQNRTDLPANLGEAKNWRL